MKILPTFFECRYDITKGRIPNIPIQLNFDATSIIIDTIHPITINLNIRHK